MKDLVKENRHLRQRIFKLENENARLEYLSQLNYQCAVAHNAERMADYERFRNRIRELLKIRPFGPASRNRYLRMIKRDTKALFARRNKW